MTVYQELILMTVIIINIVDISGFVGSMKRALWRWLKGSKPYRDYSIKPFDCSYCLAWWCGLGYLIYADSVTFGSVLYVLCLAWLTPYLRDFQLWVGEVIQGALENLWSRL